VGEYIFQSQYQQDPTSREGGLIKGEWLEYYEPDQLPKEFGYVLQSWDTASNCGELNDYSVCTTWGLLNMDFYLLDVYRRRLSYPDLKRAVGQDLRSDGVYCVDAYKPAPGSDKIMRLGKQSIKFENRRVYLPRKALWLDDYVREITSFPGSKHDDQVDSTSQALDYLERFATPANYRPFNLWNMGYERC
jgi:phage terminase large subunit-like protein